MTRLTVLGKAVALIALITVASGALQMVRPGLVLGIVGARAEPAGAHFFALVGMFMALFGGLALHGLYLGSAPAILWSGLQKVGAVIGVAAGVAQAIFSNLALAVAGFDLLSAILILVYWRTLAGRPS